MIDDYCLLIELIEFITIDGILFRFEDDNNNN